MTKEEHDLMVHNFVDHLAPSTEYSTEYPVSVDEKNIGFIDVVVLSKGHAFLFDMKSGSNDFSKDIQQLRRYAHALRHTPAHSWRWIHAFLVYHAGLKDRIIAVRNIFGGVEVLLMENSKEPSDLDGRHLKSIIESVGGRFWRLKVLLRILSRNG
jgi:hypothetical protein